MQCINGTAAAIGRICSQSCQTKTVKPTGFPTKDETSETTVRNLVNLVSWYSGFPVALKLFLSVPDYLIYPTESLFSRQKIKFNLHIVTFKEFQVVIKVLSFVDNSVCFTKAHYVAQYVEGGGEVQYTGFVEYFSA